MGVIQMKVWSMTYTLNWGVGTNEGGLGLEMGGTVPFTNYGLNHKAYILVRIIHPQTSFLKKKLRPSWFILICIIYAFSIFLTTLKDSVKGTWPQVAFPFVFKRCAGKPIQCSDVLKVHQCRFENLPVCSCSYKTNILKVSHS